MSEAIPHKPKGAVYLGIPFLCASIAVILYGAACVGVRSNHSSDPDIVSQVVHADDDHTVITTYEPSFPDGVTYFGDIPETVSWHSTPVTGNLGVACLEFEDADPKGFVINLEKPFFVQMVERSHWFMKRFPPESMKVATQYCVANAPFETG